jgi:hypothetical protein
MQTAPTESTAEVARTRSRSGASGPESRATSASRRPRKCANLSLPACMACMEAWFWFTKRKTSLRASTIPTYRSRISWRVSAVRGWFLAQSRRASISAK